MNQFEHGFALLIGVDENSVPEWQLPEVSKDIAALAQVLTHPQRCAYPTEHIKVISGKAATRQGILDGLDWLQEQVSVDPSGNATALIHYSGHGWRDCSAQSPDYYLIPYDVRKDTLRARALRAEDFANTIQLMTPRRLLVILDCCHADGMNIRGALPGGGFPGTALPPDLLMAGEPSAGVVEGARGLEALAQGQGRAVLSSSQADQPSYNRRDGKMGIFTYHLIEALTGHAQPQAGASEVLVSDVMSYVWRRVPDSAQTEWGATQTPNYQVSGNFPVALLLGGRWLAEGQQAPDPLKTSDLSAQNPSYSIQTSGGDFTGRDKIVQSDYVRGDKVHGDSIRVGNISGSGSAIAIGRNARVSVTSGVSGNDLDRVFAPAILALRDVSPEHRGEAAAQLDALRQEASRGSQADDQKMASLLDGLLELAPELIGAIAGAFGSPPLAGITGPVTSFVLGRFQKAKHRSG